MLERLIAGESDDNAMIFDMWRRECSTHSSSVRRQASYGSIHAIITVGGHLQRLLIACTMLSKVFLVWLTVDVRRVDHTSIYLASYLVAIRHAGFVAFVVRVPDAPAIASTGALALARGCSSGEWSTSSPDPK